MDKQLRDHLLAVAEAIETLSIPIFVRLAALPARDTHMLFAFDAQAQQAARQYGLPHTLTQDATPAMVAANIRAYVERNISK